MIFYITTTIRRLVQDIFRSASISFYYIHILLDIDFPEHIHFPPNIQFLWHIDEALRRLYRSPETFGKCHQCGNEIAFERLDALPHARYCIDCKQREEDAKK